MNDLRDRIGQVIHFYDSSGYKPRFPKIISTEDDLPKPPDEGWLPPCSLDLLSESSSPSIHTYLGIWLLSPFSLYSWDRSIAPERWSVQLRAHKACSSEEGKFVLSETYQCPIQYVFSWDENTRDTVNTAWKMIPQILYSNHLYNTNKYITSDPEILVKYYEGKVCNCEIKERCDYLILQSLYNYH